MRKSKHRPPTRAAIERAKNDYRQYLIRLRSESWRQYDRTIMTVASGAIALTLHFVTAAHPTAFLCMLGVGLFSLVLSLLSALAGFCAAAIAAGMAVVTLDTNPGKLNQPTYADTAVHVFNALASLLLAIGTVTTLTFFYINLL